MAGGRGAEASGGLGGWGSRAGGQEAGGVESGGKEAGEGGGVGRLGESGPGVRRRGVGVETGWPGSRGFGRPEGVGVCRRR